MVNFHVKRKSELKLQIINVWIRKVDKFVIIFILITQLIDNINFCISSGLSPNQIPKFNFEKKKRLIIIFYGLHYQFGTVHT